MTNLYTNPGEDISIGVRHLPMAVVVGGEGLRYKKVLEKFPIQVKVGFASN
jgi:arylsulfatase